MMTFEYLAEMLMFGKIKNKKQLEEKIKGHWEFRKGKDILDVNKAIEKGLKMGMGKTEWEIEGVALYLKDVFKSV